MKKIYRVQRFCFYIEKGIERQIANCGETGYNFTSYKKAEKFFLEELESRGIKKESQIQLFPYVHLVNYFTIDDYQYKEVFTLQEIELI